MQNQSQRRSFLKKGLLGVAALAAAGTGYKLIDAHLHPDLGPSKYILDDSAKMVLAALIPVFLQGALPTEAGALSAAVQKSISHVQSAVNSLPFIAQKEVADLFNLLAAAPARRWLAGVADEWPQARAEQIRAFLQAWRGHRSPTLQSGYLALHDLVIGPWYGDESTWASIGYPGPIKELR